MSPDARPGSLRPSWIKLGLRETDVLTLVARPTGWALPELPRSVTVVDDEHPVAPCALLVVFFRGATELDRLAPLSRAIYPNGAIWACWPRKAAGHVSDFGDNVVRAAARKLGLVDVKVAAVDHDWSGLRLVWRVENRPTAGQREPRPTGSG